MFTDLEFIKTCLNAITCKFRRIKSDVDAVKSDVDAVKSSSPDWNEPNIASHAYIKNKPFGKRLVVTGTSAMSNQRAAFIASNVPKNALVVGRYYAVYVDGKLSFSAECVAETSTDAYPSLYYPGSADWGDSSIHLRPDGQLIAWTSDRGPWFTEGLPVEIYEVTQIPPEYLTAPDWNESDTASNSYVKNKPCYDYIEPSVVIWESDSAGISSQYEMALVDLGDRWLIEGETYRLTVDGVETTYVCAADADGRGLYIGAGYADSNNGSIFQSNTNASLSALTSGLWDYGQKVRLEGPLRKYKKLNASMYDAVEVDSTLTQSGQAADAAEVGNRISSLSEEIVTTSESKVAAHNTGTDTHSDIRVLIQGLTDRLNALADSDDTTLDQLSEVVLYIKSNRSLIEAITTSKVGVADIIDNLTTNVTNKPLSAAQGVALKALIDAISIPDKLPNPNALTFTGAVTGIYDGSMAVSVEIPSTVTDDHINSLIDTKLGVIENGAY